MRHELRTFNFRTSLGRRIIRAGCEGEAIRCLMFYLTPGETVLWRSEIVRGDNLYHAETGELHTAASNPLRFRG